MYELKPELPVKFPSLPSPLAAIPTDGALPKQRLYTPRWRWSAAHSLAPPVLGGAPQCYPLDILGVLNPPPTAASTHCTLPGAVLSVTQSATLAFGALPFAVLMTLIAVCEARLFPALRSCCGDLPIRVGLFGPGAAATYHAATAIHPETARYLLNLYAVRGAPDDPNTDPLPRGVWPVLCPAYLPSRPAPTSNRMVVPTEVTHKHHNTSLLAGIAAKSVTCDQREILVSICADDAEASYLPPDVRHRGPALPRLMERLYAVLSVLAPLDGAHRPIERLGSNSGASLASEMAETAFELAMVARTHLVAFYARVRPARTGPVHRAAAAMMRHRPLSISPTTLASDVEGRHLRVLEAAGWLEARDEETAHGLALRFMPSEAFLRLEPFDLPKKRASHPSPISVLCDGLSANIQN